MHKYKPSPPCLWRHTRRSLQPDIHLAIPRRRHAEIENGQNQILTEINSIFNNQTTPSEAEVELVQSRLVLALKPLTT